MTGPLFRAECEKYDLIIKAGKQWTQPFILQAVVQGG